MSRRTVLIFGSVLLALVGVAVIVGIGSHRHSVDSIPAAVTTYDSDVQHAEQAITAACGNLGNPIKPPIVWGRYHENSPYDPSVSIDYADGRATVELGGFVVCPDGG